MATDDAKVTFNWDLPTPDPQPQSESKARDERIRQLEEDARGLTGTDVGAVRYLASVVYDLEIKLAVETEARINRDKLISQWRTR